MSDPTDALIEAATMAREHGMTVTECRAVIRDVFSAPCSDDLLLGIPKGKTKHPATRARTGCLFCTVCAHHRKG